MKILMVAPYPYPGTPIRGGVETVTYNLIEGFREIPDVQLTVLSICKDVDETINLSNNVKVRFIKSEYASRKVELRKHVKPILLETNAAWEPDIVHFQGNGSTFLLYDKAIARKLVVTQHGIIWNEMKQTKALRPKMNMFVAWFIERCYRAKVRNWIYISDYNLALNSTFNRRNHINYCKIYNPVNPEFCRQPSFRNSKGSINLLFVGRIVPLKGLPDLLVAFAHTSSPNIRLHVVGGYETVEYETEIKELINRYQISDRVIFYGWKTSDEIIKIYETVDALVLPSYQETLPCVIAEAMALGKIVVSTRIGGIPEMIDQGETGFLYYPGDITSLTMAITHFSNLSQEQRKQMSEKAKTKALNMYMPLNVAKQHLSFYDWIIGNH